MPASTLNWGDVGSNENFPDMLQCKKSPEKFLRERPVRSGAGGYVALFEIEADSIVTILVARHQRKEDDL